MAELVLKDHADYLCLIEWLEEKQHSWDESDWALWFSEGLSPHTGVPAANSFPGGPVHVFGADWEWEWHIGRKLDHNHIRLLHRICSDMNTDVHARSCGSHIRWDFEAAWRPNPYSQAGRSIFAVTGTGAFHPGEEKSVRHLILRLCNRIKAAFAIRNPFSCQIGDLGHSSKGRQIS